MKKSLILFGLAVWVAVPALALDMTPLQIGIWGPKVQLFPEQTKVIGLRLNLLMSDNQDVTGFDLGLASKSTQMKAIQVNLVNVVREEFDGVSLGLFNQAGSVAGIQAGLLFNNVRHDLSGFQLGLFNVADDVAGIQVGLINRTVSMRGLQIGVVNIIEDGPIGFFPIINGAF
jgi:hypothetical protein